MSLIKKVVWRDLAFFITVAQLGTIAIARIWQCRLRFPHECIWFIFDTSRSAISVKTIFLAFICCTEVFCDSQANCLQCFTVIGCLFGCLWISTRLIADLCRSVSRIWVTEVDGYHLERSFWVAILPHWCLLVGWLVSWLAFLLDTRHNFVLIARFFAAKIFSANAI